MKKLLFAIVVLLVVGAVSALGAASTNVYTNAVGQVVTVTTDTSGRITTSIAASSTPSGASAAVVGPYVDATLILGNVPLAAVTNLAKSLGAYLGGNIPVAAITNAAKTVGASIGGNIPSAAMTNALNPNLLSYSYTAAVFNAAGVLSSQRVTIVNGALSSTAAVTP